MKRMKYISLMMVGALLSMMNMSCQDDLLYDVNGQPIEGIPVTVTLKVNLTDMPQLSRGAIVEDAQSYNCTDLWVGIYRVGGDNDGKLITSEYYTKVGDYLESANQRYTLGELKIDTESGNARIVAVANTGSCDAQASPDADLTSSTSLKDLLDAASTWDDFCKICARRSEATDIYQMTYDIPMSGYYCEDDESYTLTGNEVPTVAIVGNERVNLPGAINLRRLVTYNKFTIVAGDNIDLDLETWQVCNNPYLCYMFEQPTNAGDDATQEGVYNDAVVSPSFERDADGNRGFEFYQYENKHTACPYATVDGEKVGIRETGTVSEMYNDREREYKTADQADGTATGKYTNKGIYRSLVDYNDYGEWNNNASYVLLKAKISYYIEDDAAGYNRAHPDEAVAEAKTDDHKQIHRTAETTYIIHLGYCKAKDSSGKPTRNTAMDFNCDRNSHYTYKVTINGVNNIVVEAKGDEQESGAEGTVYDSYGDNIELDSHYCVFNIDLSNVERSTLKYNVDAPYDGVLHSFDSKNYDEKWETNQLFTWIKILPTSGEKVLAAYPGDGDSSLWSLRDLKDVSGHPGYNGSTDESDNTQQWYTVFIDEYVYHDGETKNGDAYDETLWKKYVNQDNRTVEIYATNDLSKDKESDYKLCKFAFTQKAIQTYYDCNKSEKGLGVEHTNESYGLNFRWNGTRDIPSSGSTDDSANDLKINNGRLNLYNYVNTYSKFTDITNWSNYVQLVPEYITGDKNELYKVELKHDDAKYPVAKLALGSGSFYNTDVSPSSSEYYYVNSACMNRNRDLNGNGKIDKEEIRWFLPTYNQYVQIMVGLSGLIDPLIDWNDYPESRFSEVGYAYGHNTEGRQNFHFATSDGIYLWAEEGYSKGYSVFYGADYVYQAYDIRCVRYLGDNPGSTPGSESEVPTAFSRLSDEAYTVNHDHYIVDASYYVDECLRPYVSTYLAPHKVNSDLNRPYKRFEISENFVSGEIVNDDGTKLLSGTNQLDPTGIGSKDYEDITNRWYRSLVNNKFCGSYTQDADGSDKGHWRVPNIKELAMIMTSGEFTGDGCTDTSHTDYMLGCTYEYFINFPNNTGSDQCKYAFLGRLGSGNITRSVVPNSYNFSLVKVRCVRDVK